MLRRVLGLCLALCSSWVTATESLDWVGAGGHQVEELLQELSGAAELGLDPHVFNIDALHDQLKVKQPNTALERAQFNLLFTEAFDNFAQQRFSGWLDPNKFESEWIGPHREDAALIEKAHQAMLNDQVGTFLRGLDPNWGNFSALVKAKDSVREWTKQMPWTTISIYQAIKPGYVGPEIGLLRQRLAATNELGEANPIGENFDEVLSEALKRFQARHGLEQDGVLGSSTVRELNVLPEWRLQQIDANLERYRWLPEGWGDRYVVINVPDYRLNVMENGKTVLRMYVVGGGDNRHVPQIHDSISSVVLNPTWRVPAQVDRSDSLLHIVDDPHHFKKNNFQIFKRESGREFLFESNEFEWNKSPLSFYSYHFKPRSGIQHVLGSVKFMLPNSGGVYLQDINAQELFRRPLRNANYGCERVEKPYDLLDYAFLGDANWTSEKLREKIGKGDELSIVLPDKIMVHVVYWTAWVDDDGQLQFRDDVYGRDQAIIDKK